MKTKPRKLEFGLQPPARVKVAWGARALYKLDRSTGDGEFELLWDRQSWYGPAEIRGPLKDWVNGTGLRELREMVAREGMPSNHDSDITFEDHDAGFLIKGNPRGSCGYLYIVAHPLPKAKKAVRR